MAFVTAIIWFLILLVLLTCFGMAALAEFRSGNRGAGFLLSIAESTAGMISSFALPSKFWGLTGLSSARLSWTMVCVSLLMVGLALLSKYASRAALFFVLIGNGMLAFLWYFNGAYHDVTDDRTGSIVWAYEWDIEDPIARITEKFTPGTVSKHGPIIFPPVLGQNGTIYLLRPHDYTDPKGLSLAAFDPNWQWEIRPSGGICTLPAIADDGTILFGTGTDVGSIPRGLYAGQGLAWAVSPEGKRNGLMNFRPPPFSLPATMAVAPLFLLGRQPAANLPLLRTGPPTGWVTAFMHSRATAPYDGHLIPARTSLSSASPTMAPCMRSLRALFSLSRRMAHRNGNTPFKSQSILLVSLRSAQTEPFI